MAYTDFKNISQVCETFDCDYEQIQFVQEKEIKINDFYLEIIKKNFNNPSSFINEYVICERIISPIINFVGDENNLPSWSHVEFNVDKEKGLTGYTDYLFAPALRGGMGFKLPVVCLGEAKKDKFDEAWGQTGAEMVAAQIANKNKEVPIYGLATNGEIWKFGKLVGSLFTIDSRPISVENFQHVFNMLNWLFCESRKSADILLEIEAKEKAEKLKQEKL